MADLRPQYTEEVVGHGHPTKADVTNRAWNVQHEEDGTHKPDIIDSPQYVDGSIDLIHMSAESVDSPQYVDGSIDEEHLAIKYLVTDGIAGRIIRCSKIEIANATDDNEILFIMNSQWNGDTIGAVNNIGKGETVNGISLDADGDKVTIDSSRITGNCIAVISCVFYSNYSGTHLTFRAVAGANDILMFFFQAPDGAAPDLTVLVDTGEVGLLITYITDA